MSGSKGDSSTEPSSLRPGGPRIFVQIGLLLPTAHAHGDNGSLFDQLFDRQPRVCGGDAIVIAQVVRRRDTERPPGVLAAWCGELEGSAGQHPLG
jgi:hypothetical protein